MKCLVSDDADQCLCITGSDRSHVFFPVARGPMPDSAPRLNTSFKILKNLKLYSYVFA